MEDVNIVCVAFLVSEEYIITHYKLKDCLDLHQNEETSDRHQWLYRKLKISLAEKYLDSTEKRLHGKIFRIQKFLDSKVPSLDCGFKISGDMTKPGYFHFGFVLLCVNGKTKRY